MNFLTKAVDLELKNLSEDGRFSGYGSVFNTRDQGGDTVEPGAYEKSLKRWAALGRQVPMLWQHKTDEPIGTHPNLSEDDHGLLTTDAELWTAEAPYARIAHKGMLTKSITGMSIGYRVKRAEYDKKNETNRLIELDLVELSVVTNPMHDDARVASVKSMLEAGVLPSMKEFEDFLREAGFSKSQAAAVAVHGLSKLHRGEPDSIQSDVINLLSNFKLTR